MIELKAFATRLKASAAMGARSALLFALLLLSSPLSSHAQEDDSVDTEEPEVDIPVEQPPEELWIEHFDKASGKNFYYEEKTRKTSWEAPAGAKIKYMNSDEQQQARGGGSGGGGSGKSSGNAGMVILAILLPIGLPFLALFYCYWAASKEGLGDVLAMLRKKRDRSAKRRGTKAGGNFRQRQKTSQDGKGGRSANS